MCFKLKKNSIKTTHKIYLSLGSNLGNKFKNLQLAVNAIFEEIGAIKKIAPIFETPAMGFEGDDFLNLIFAGETELSFEDLNNKLKKIEDASGRQRNVPKFSARTLDIDIVLQINEDEILFESDEVSKYSFVSEPLKEII